MFLITIIQMKSNKKNKTNKKAEGYKANSIQKMNPTFFVRYSLHTKSKMSIPPLPDISTLTHFPIPESNWLEFKVATTPCMLNKLPITICALLNSSGGYIVVGVEDASLLIVGISVIEYDRLALFVDNIFRSGSVLRFDGKILPLETLKCSHEMTSNGKRIAVIKITPEEDTKYKLRNNEMYYRLSASNFRYSMEREMFTKQEMEVYAIKRASAFQQIADQKSELVERLQNDCDSLLSQAKKLEKDKDTLLESLDKYTTESEYLKRELEKASKCLEYTILSNKQLKEKELYSSKSGFIELLKSLFCVF